MLLLWLSLLFIYHRLCSAIKRRYPSLPPFPLDAGVPSHFIIIFPLSLLQLCLVAYRVRRFSGDLSATAAPPRAGDASGQRARQGPERGQIPQPMSCQRIKPRSLSETRLTDHPRRRSPRQRESQSRERAKPKGKSPGRQKASRRPRIAGGGGGRS